MPPAERQQMIDISGVHIAQCYRTFSSAGLISSRSLAKVLWAVGLKGYQARCERELTWQINQHSHHL